MLEMMIESMFAVQSVREDEDRDAVYVHLGSEAELDEIRDAARF